MNQAVSQAANHGLRAPNDRYGKEANQGLRTNIIHLVYVGRVYFSAGSAEPDK